MGLCGNIPYTLKCNNLWVSRCFTWLREVRDQTQTPIQQTLPKMSALSFGLRLQVFSFLQLKCGDRPVLTLSGAAPATLARKGHRFLSATTHACAAPLSAKIFDGIHSGSWHFFVQNSTVNDSIQPCEAVPISNNYHKKQPLQSANDRTEITPKATEALLYFCR